jgi:hypothetical protein
MGAASYGARTNTQPSSLPTTLLLRTGLPRYKGRLSNHKACSMKYLVPGMLLLVAATHALPLAGVLGASKLVALYGIPVADANLELVLRHRAVLFGLLAAFLAYAAFQPALHGLAIIAGSVSVVSFIVLAHLGGQAPGTLNAALMRVVRVDYAAVVLLAVASVAHVARMRAG